MKHIYPKALELINRRIKSCGRALATQLEAHSIIYWHKELNKANRTKSRILARMPQNDNVIYIDFKNKRKAA